MLDYDIREEVGAQYEAPFVPLDPWVLNIHHVVMDYLTASHHPFAYGVA